METQAVVSKNGLAVTKFQARPSISLTFTQKVTRDQLIANLDRILREVGCLACGLNGIDFIQLKGDPFPEFTRIRPKLGDFEELGLIDVDIKQTVGQAF